MSLKHDVNGEATDMDHVTTRIIILHDIRQDSISKMYST